MSFLVRTCSTDRMNISRLIARILIVVGGLLWAMAAFAESTTQKYSDLTYSFSEVVDAGVNAIIPLVITAALFALAMFYERLAGVLFLAAAVAFAAWGLAVELEAGVYISAMAVLVLPMVVAGVLLLLAASTQHVCELEGVTQ